MKHSIFALILALVGSAAHGGTYYCTADGEQHLIVTNSQGQATLISGTQGSLGSGSRILGGTGITYYGGVYEMGFVDSLAVDWDKHSDRCYVYKTHIEIRLPKSNKNVLRGTYWWSETEVRNPNWQGSCAMPDRMFPPAVPIVCRRSTLGF
jgi:hypothetical protein